MKEMTKEDKKKFGNRFIGFELINFKGRKVKKYIPNSEISDNVEYITNNL